MKRLRLILREIRNYLYLQKTLRREARKTSEESPWVIHRLRKNWYGRIYTVISLREQDMGEEEMVQNWRAMEMMRPINDYLTTLGLQEIIFPSIEKIPDSRSYLIVYSPLFKELTLSWFLWRLLALAFVASATYLIYATL